MRLKISEALEFLVEMEKDIENVRRCLLFLDKKNALCKICFHKTSVSSRDAAKNLDCSIEEIVKSIVVTDGKKSMLLLLSGNGKIDFTRFSGFRMATAQEVFESTGYRIGSVSPFDLKIPVFMDKKLLSLKVTRPACGSTCVGVEIAPKELKRVCNAKVLEFSV
jgi:prolyl-tRNA editing enzyme YbaK/EbsC (Cys-tRNA(Pro) deacylase)